MTLKKLIIHFLCWFSGHRLLPKKRKYHFKNEGRTVLLSECLCGATARPIIDPAEAIHFIAFFMRADPATGERPWRLL
jgi:hypothetical protein